MTTYGFGYGLSYRTYNATGVDTATLDQDAKQVRIKALIARDAAPLGDHIIKGLNKWYENSKIEIIQFGYKKHYLAYQVNGKWYGWDMPYCDYKMCVEVRKQLLEHPLDETGIAF